MLATSRSRNWRSRQFWRSVPTKPAIWHVLSSKATKIGRHLNVTSGMNTKLKRKRRQIEARLSATWLGSVPVAARFRDRHESGKRRPGILPSGRDAVDALVTVTDALGLRKLRAGARHTNALDVNIVWPRSHYFAAHYVIVWRHAGATNQSAGTCRITCRYQSSTARGVDTYTVCRTLMLLCHLKSTLEKLFVIWMWINPTISWLLNIRYPTQRVQFHGLQIKHVNRELRRYWPQTISATTMSATDEIGHRARRPQPIPYRPQAKSISVTDNFTEWQ